MITLVLLDNSCISLQNEAFERAEFYGIKENWILIPETVLTKKFETTYTSTYIYLVINKKFLQSSQIQHLSDSSASQILVSDNRDGINQKKIIIHNLMFVTKQEFTDSVVLTFKASR